MIPLRIALAYWFKLGWISFGGPAGQVALMHDELVTRRAWISERRFLHALNYCMLLPGPEAQQLATYLGWLMHGTRGGIAAGVLFVLPSLLILIMLSALYLAYAEVHWVAALFDGVRPAVVALVALAATRLATRTLRHRVLLTLAVLAFIASFMLPFPLVIAAAGVAGWALAKRWPQAFTAKAAAQAAHTAAIIGDDTPTPTHAAFSRRGLVRVLMTGLLLWAAPLACLSLALGWAHGYTQMAWFFTKAALLTFGGAYAVLPYVQQHAVAATGWLTQGQMLDGLALGESTPGPLIMIVVFVGFIAASQHAWLGPDATLAAGVVGAVLVTWFTFLPSFVFIFAGAPLIEATRQQPALGAPLTAISAALVGVIAGFGVTLAQHVIWPGRPDGFAAVLALLAFAALWRFKRPVIEVLALCAAAGVLRYLL
ncbi:chromate efflux transporter [Chitinibacteraceae bacterium HSL-7]